MGLCKFQLYKVIIAHFQTAGHSGFINYTEIRFTDKIDPSDPTRREDFWIDTLLKLAITRALIILTHILVIYCFCSFTSFHCIYGKCLFLSFLLSTGYFYLLCPLWLGRLLCNPPRRFFLVSPRLVTCLLVLLFLFISSYYLGHCSFSPWYSHS